MEILILSIKKDDDNLFIIEKENGDINFLSKTPESNIERGKKYFTIDKSKITLNGYFYNTYEIFHYDGPNHPSGTEYGYIFLKNGKKNIIRDDYLKMKFHEDKTIEYNSFIGLDTRYTQMIKSTYHFDASVTQNLDKAISKNNNDIINKSRILCLFKLLYHKFIFIDVNFIFELIQTLLLENLVDFSN